MSLTRHFKQNTKLVILFNRTHIKILISTGHRLQIPFDFGRVEDPQIGQVLQEQGRPPTKLEIRVSHRLSSRRLNYLFI